MSAAFLTGALAAGVAGAGMAALVIWIVTVVSGSAEPWRSAPLIVAVVAALLGIATYAGERFVYRRSMERKRATGEPWAYRED